MSPALWLHNIYTPFQLHCSREIESGTEDSVVGGSNNTLKLTGIEDLCYVKKSRRLDARGDQERSVARTSFRQAMAK